MQTQITELKTLLHEETEHLRQMEAVMQDKKSCLVGNNTAGLMKADQALMAIGQKTTQLEQQRLELMKQMGFADQSLEQLVQSLCQSHPAQGRELQQTRSAMRRLLDSIQVLNRNNQELLALSIQWIADTVDLIARQVNPEAASYTATGKKKQSKQNGAQTLNIQSTVIHNA